MRAAVIVAVLFAVLAVGEIQATEQASNPVHPGHFTPAIHQAQRPLRDVLPEIVVVAQRLPCPHISYCGTAFLRRCGTNRDCLAGFVPIAPTVLAAARECLRNKWASKKPTVTKDLGHGNANRAALPGI
jgi:hypothetical protein